MAHALNGSASDWRYANLYVKYIEVFNLLANRLQAHFQQDAHVQSTAVELMLEFAATDGRHRAFY
jgi:hypothetical protein